MAHFAKLDADSIVTDVIVVNNESIDNLPFPESEPVGVTFLIDWSGGYSNWKQTSYNAQFRKNYASSGYSYDIGRDAFIPPRPYPSWLLDEQTCQWDPPVPYPTDGKPYVWDETTKTWVASDT